MSRANPPVLPAAWAAFCHDARGLRDHPAAEHGRAVGPATERAGAVEGDGAAAGRALPRGAVRLVRGDRQAGDAGAGKCGVAGVAPEAGARHAVRVHPGWRDVAGDEVFAEIVRRWGGGR